MFDDLRSLSAIDDYAESLGILSLIISLLKFCSGRVNPNKEVETKFGLWTSDNSFSLNTLSKNKNRMLRHPVFILFIDLSC